MVGTFSGYYSYHKDGNLSARYQGGLSESFGYDFDGDGIDESNMLTSIGSNSSLAWDDNGQLICDGGINFVYDYDNKLDYASSVSGPTIYVDYEYDPLGNLSGRSDYVQGIGTRQSRYIQDYSGGLPKVLVELEPDGSGGWSVVAQNYHYGDRLVLSQSASGNSSYYIHDRNGNVRNIINSSQTVLNSYSYTAYGEDIASQCFETVPNNWKFSGQYHDKQLDQYYLRARMYSPYLSRFNGYDPVIGGYTEPLTLHQYLYCLNDPVNYTDPTGKILYGDTMGANATYAKLASQAFDTAMNVKDYAQLVSSSASIQSAVLSIAIDVGIDAAGGKFFDKAIHVFGGVGKIANKLGDFSTQGHHVIAKFLGGKAYGRLVKLLRKEHYGAGDSYHNILRNKLKEQFGDDMPKMSTEAWKKYLEDGDPLKQIKLQSALIDAAGDFDLKHGKDILSSATVEELISQFY